MSGYSHPVVHEVNIDTDVLNRLSALSASQGSMVIPGLSRSVCGMNWLLEYIETMPPALKSTVVHTPSNGLFKLSHVCGIVYSVLQVTLPEVVIDNITCKVQVEVVNHNIPLLLARADLIELQETVRSPYKANKPSMFIEDEDSSKEVMGGRTELVGSPDKTLKQSTIEINGSSSQEVVIVRSGVVSAESCSSDDSGKTKLHEKFEKKTLFWKQKIWRTKMKKRSTCKKKGRQSWMKRRKKINKNIEKTLFWKPMIWKTKRKKRPIYKEKGRHSWMKRRKKINKCRKQRILSPMKEDKVVNPKESWKRRKKKTLHIACPNKKSPFASSSSQEVQNTLCKISECASTMIMEISSRRT